MRKSTTAGSPIASTRTVVAIASSIDPSVTWMSQKFQYSAPRATVEQHAEPGDRRGDQTGKVRATSSRGPRPAAVNSSELADERDGGADRVEGEQQRDGERHGGGELA